jgi:membrane-bound metal-dependent hydrolase YbcI (DUF457 family)
MNFQKNFLCGDRLFYLNPYFRDMLGRRHLLLSLGTALAPLMPLIMEMPVAVAVTLLGVAVGSLIPDSDTSGSTVFRLQVPGLRGRIGKVINNSVAPLLPVFGYISRYTILFPVTWLLDHLLDEDVSRGHRDFSHSLTGAGSFLLLTSVYMSPVALWLGAFDLLLWFVSGYAFGFLMHLLQDSCTVSGIRWLYPFRSLKLSGSLVTKSGSQSDRRPEYLVYVLGILLSGLAAASVNPSLTTSYVSFLGAFLVSVLWAVFVSGVASVRID